MALTNYIEINITSNTKLYTNTQHILAFIYATRPKNISLIYKPKQREFKVRRI